MGRHDRFIQQAVELAETSAHLQWKLGAIITQGSKVISLSTNKLRNPPTINHLHSTRHAEMAALRRCVLPLKGCHHICSKG